MAAAIQPATRDEMEKVRVCQASDGGRGGGGGVKQEEYNVQSRRLILVTKEETVYYSILRRGQELTGLTLGLLRMRW